MKFQTAIDIEATPDTVWRTLTDVESWPDEAHPLLRRLGTLLA